MIDTGATYSSIRKEGSQLPLTCKAIQTMGFTGKVQTLRFTEPQELTLDGVTIQAPLLYSPGAPVNLLGRDALCKLGAQIQCEATEIWVKIPQTYSHAVCAPARHQRNCLRNKQCILAGDIRPVSLRTMEEILRMETVVTVHAVRLQRSRHSSTLHNQI